MRKPSGYLVGLHTHPLLVINNDDRFKLKHFLLLVLSLCLNEN